MDIEKYRKAGLIVQSGLLYASKLVHSNFGSQDIGLICRTIDEFLLQQVKLGYKAVKEKGIAAPTEICKGDLASGVAPESIDEFQGGMIQEGDVVKVSLGVHIDGYTVIGAHTLVIREQVPENPVEGTDADAYVAAFLANEAVISLLSSTLSEQYPVQLEASCQQIRDVVDSIATAFDCAVVPGSQVRRISRFVSGQDTVQEGNAKAVQWESEGVQVSEDAAAQADEVWLVDVSMVSKHEQHDAKIRRVEFNGYGSRKELPTVYTRDYTMSYALKNGNSRVLLAKADELSVFPFKLGHLASDESELKKLRLGLAECVQRRLLVPSPRFQVRVSTTNDRIGQLSTVAREASTVALVSGDKSGSGFPEVLRLSGGKQLPASWVRSKYELPAGVAAELLNARLVKHQGFKYIEVKANTTNGVSGVSAKEPEMDVE